MVRETTFFLFLPAETVTVQAPLHGRTNVKLSTMLLTFVLFIEEYTSFDNVFCKFTLLGLLHSRLAGTFHSILSQQPALARVEATRKMQFNLNLNHQK
jgi:hypothetical protein